MKYIKNAIIKETPIEISADGFTVELTDSQLRKNGWLPLDEVIYAQGDALMSASPDVNDIKNDLINSLSVDIPEGGFPFKLGYKWVPVISGNKVIFENVRDDNAVGTANNPIIYVESVRLIPNAYYLYEGERYVYVGAPGSLALNWETDSENFELF